MEQLVLALQLDARYSVVLFALMVFTHLLVSKTSEKASIKKDKK